MTKSKRMKQKSSKRATTRRKSKRVKSATRRKSKRVKRATRVKKSVKKTIQRGGGGLFGESQGTCGWGNHPSCCFTSCAPMWRTSLWPISDITM
jgi:hypothetical protein